MMPPETPDGANGQDASLRRSTRSGFSIFTIPRPIKVLFERFPLVTYPANELPQRSLSAKKGRGHALFLWAVPEDASVGVASFNPNCLKWQAYLTSQRIRYHIVASNNHASTSERLPFLVPDPTQPAPFKGTKPLSTHQLAKWGVNNADSWPKNLDLQYEAYMSLLDNSVRRAWLHHMYLTTNFEKFTVPSYIGTQSSSSFVRTINAWELRNAARAELAKHTPVVDVDGLYLEVEEAFEALDNLIARKEKSDTVGKPSLLEATLFAYLFLLLETPYSAWADARLVDIVRKFPNLGKHEAALNTSHFGSLKPPRLHGGTAS